MIFLKRVEAFKRAVSAFGPWSTWSRFQNVAYGLIRGVAYSRMEKCSNDNPEPYRVAWELRKLGAWEGITHPTKGYESVPRPQVDEVSALVVWVRKPIRKKDHMVPTEPVASVSETQ